MGESSPVSDALTIEGLGGLFNGEVFVLSPGQSGTVGKSTIASFPVTLCRNYRRLEGDPGRDGLLKTLAPEHVRFLYLGGGRLIVENLPGRDVLVGNRPLTDRLEVDLAKGALEIRFGYGERVRVSSPASLVRLQELAPQRDEEAAVEGVFMALLNPDGSLAIPDRIPKHEEFRLAPEEPEPDIDPEADTGPIPEVSEEELAAARRRGRKRGGLFGRSPAFLISMLFHVVVILSLFATYHLVAKPDTGGWIADAAVESSRMVEEPEEKEDRKTPEEQVTEETADESTADDTTPMVDETASEAATDPGQDEAGPNVAGRGMDGLLGIGSGGIGDGGPLGSGRGGAGGARRRGGRSSVVDRALGWLVEHQLDDGSWGGVASVKKCRKCNLPAQRNYTAAMTGLAMLAFSGAGHTHRDGTHRKSVMKAVRFLVKRQEPDGSFHPAGTAKTEREMYGDAIATLALVEMYRVSNAPLIRSAAARGLRHLERSQAPYSGWRYQPGAGDADTSVTAWAILALKAGQHAKLAVNPAVWAGARAWISSMTEPSTYRIGYSRRGRGSAGMSAAGLSILLAAPSTSTAKSVDKTSRAAVKLLRLHPPYWPVPGEAEPPGNPPDLHYWLFGCVAASRVGGDSWTVWSRTVKKVLPPHQEKSGHLRGSFPAAGRWSRIGGRVYTTAMAAVCLTMAYDYESAMR